MMWDTSLVYCNKCKKWVHFTSATVVRCAICLTDLTDQVLNLPTRDGYEAMTNADRIRAMTDEELAKKISGIEQFALTTNGAWPADKWLDWLKQEAEEGE